MEENLLNYTKMFLLLQLKHLHCILISKEEYFMLINLHFQVQIMESSFLIQKNKNFIFNLLKYPKKERFIHHLRQHILIILSMQENSPILQNNLHHNYYWLRLWGWYTLL